MGCFFVERVVCLSCLWCICVGCQSGKGIDSVADVADFVSDVSFLLNAERAEESSVLAVGVEAEEGGFAGGVLAVASASLG